MLDGKEQTDTAVKTSNPTQYVLFVIVVRRWHLGGRLFAEAIFMFQSRRCCLFAIFAFTIFLP
jgi:hypothetical protein